MRAIARQGDSRKMIGRANAQTCLMRGLSLLFLCQLPIGRPQPTSRLRKGYTKSFCGAFYKKRQNKKPKANKTLLAKDCGARQVGCLGVGKAREVVGIDAREGVGEGLADVVESTFFFLECGQCGGEL